MWQLSFWSSGPPQLAALNCYPDETRFLLLDDSQPTVEKKIRKVPDSLLFKR
jgi:hypothetical protein